MRKVTNITHGSIGFVERGDRLHFHAEDDHREDWEGPRDFDITVRGTNLTSRHGPRIYSVEKIGPDLDDDFYLADNWTITVIPEATAPAAQHPAHAGHEYGGAFARAAALAAGDPDWMNATGGQPEAAPGDSTPPVRASKHAHKRADKLKRQDIPALTTKGRLMTADQLLLDPVETTSSTSSTSDTDATITVTVFSKNNCPDCKRLKAQFDLKGVPFREINVQEDEEPRAEFNGLTPFEHVVATYGRQMPTVVVEDGEWGDWWSGSRVDKIVETVSRFRDAGLLIPEDQRNAA